ncbi:protein EFR3 homolog B-like, partial [Empidonax traillii]|uniref:protein EFR3 homolog B-like n=1 Tax=Empidonax traillii TaxID=164674 RepID=UPI000FFDA662
FVKFANIEEDTPSYHRSYDFFVCRFSEMCHSSHEDPAVRARIRMSGIKGLQGVVRKTVNDELQANIWDPQHMDKIVPSLLFNLQHGEEPQSRSPSPVGGARKEREVPADLAERCLRELLARAAFGNIKNALTPVLLHLDNHSLWEPKVFATGCFRIIMYSIQPQHSHLVIQQLLGHLDSHSRSAAPIRAGIVEVLSEAAAIAASGSVGPTVLEVFNTLLRQLRLSIDYALTGTYDGVGSAIGSGISSGISSGPGLGSRMIKEQEERMFQEAVIKTIGSFASTLPTYQQSEVMVFIMNKVPLPCSQHSMEPGKDGENRNRLTQIMLLKSLLQVGIPWEKSLRNCSRMGGSALNPPGSSGRPHTEVAQVAEGGLCPPGRCALLALAAAYLNIIAQMLALPALCQHVHQVIQARQKEAPFLLPEDVFVENPRPIPSLDELGPEFFFWQSKISEGLGGSGYSLERLSIPYVPQLT